MNGGQYTRVSLKRRLNMREILLFWLYIITMTNRDRDRYLCSEKTIGPCQGVEPGTPRTWSEQFTTVLPSRPVPISLSLRA